ncbi:GntR family transcriptional regulator [Amycolatopsis mediterranei S699]|uniref:GntR family transcriptional regulator n=3 Tax=Amycolatopsis mediterranei TaxID=33910 RepID=A0A0H3D360_AMYMU|nr:GntR family transcriptional regulator [Amycolatopsis mediterranei]ADJ43986.1 GntR family transcriptional regulator [Amycolatopsis mediterranei U32]AEK40714.1 GntR family transcriptional regulator [Amycolatopsis mediterranei S699]AFO75699.1 GntR family transcriptional regulator [Amycolatopsis mediterranei S699]AGT82828.1 GntR family transcriptional regulator [Amycolatopsis mediterranei RB]KDO06585.1 GntR family transcriptional regulator [Amycolatopsis mediterranei]
MPTLDRPEPPYLQIAGRIRDDILSGRLQEGDAVPSAREIARTWAVAMATATKVLATLRSQGLVRPVRGVGTVVDRGGLHRTARDRTAASGRTGRIYPPGHYAVIRAAGLEPAPERAAAALGLEEGAPAIRRRRTTYGPDSRPLSTSTSWFDGTLSAKAPALLVAERIVEGTAAHAAARLGTKIATTQERHAAGPAGEEEAAELGLAAGSPVLLGRSTFVAADGTVVEYGESAALPDHWVFYEYTTEDGE